MIQTKNDFIDFLRQQKQANGKRKIAESSIDLYTKAIDKLPTQINKYLNDKKIISIYSIRDSTELKEIFNKWYFNSEIRQQEKRQNEKNSNALKRYIDFLITNERNIAYYEFIDYESSKTEGGEKIVISKLAERNDTLRKIAIKIHGTCCKACKFNFYETYGEYGKDFIEIHHLVKLRNEIEFIKVKTNPLTDLIPLCSNCHRIVHRKRDITLSLEELKGKIKQNSC